MQKAQAELKNLTIFLLVILTVTALTWFVLEFVGKKPVKSSVGDVSKASIAKVKTGKNLAAEKDTSVEQVPVADENFEVYQFKDPFTPLAQADAPAENLPPPGTSQSGGTTQSSQSAPNTAINSKSNPQVVSIKAIGNEATATVIINGRKNNVTEGQTVQGYEIVNIDTANNTVDMLYGDQKLEVNLTK